MLRILFALLLLFHGLIHLMGFTKAFKLAEISQLTSPISRPAGAFWLLAAVLFVVATTLFLLKKDGWWMLALPAVALSQILIFQCWQDAKFGTAANIIALVGIVLGYGAWSFNSLVNREIEAFTTPVATPEKILTRDMVAPLPLPVRQWLERSNCIGKPLTRTVHLRQTGAMRTSPDGNWMPVTAEQYFTVDQPGFLWIADVHAYPFIHLAGRDKYQGGKGHMLIKLLSLYPVADSKGPTIDQGSMLRYLAETCWFPSAAVQPYMHWESVDSVSAKATMRYGGIEASGVFTFSPEGDLRSFEAMRYYDRKGGATLEKWFIADDPSSYQDFSDVRMPARSTVTWKLDSGDFTWFRMEIMEVEYR